MHLKIGSLISLLMFTSAVFAQSTCETRVDSHQKASTPQRVEYCLTQDVYSAPTGTRPELIYSEVSSYQPAAPEKQKEYTSSNPYFKEDKYTVTQGYVGTTQFPAFQNAIMSEQEMAAERQAWLEQQAALNPSVTPVVTRPTVTTTTTTTTTTASTKPAVTKPAVTKPAVVETRAGITRRSTKPGRTMKQVVTVEKTVSEESATPQQTQAVTTTTTTTTTATTSTTATQPDEEELGLLPTNPYAQPEDLPTNETIPYGDK